MRNRINSAFILILCLSSMVICTAVAVACDKPKNHHQEKEQVVITLNIDDEAQTIHSFGASDCWTTKFVGTWSDESKKNQVADYLFSTDTLDNGSPKGIGLTLWRFNIGGGSWEQGEDSGITDEWRREECFLSSDGTYNWNRQAGQQWFLQAARQRNVPYTLGFSLTAPVQMTRNGKAFHGGQTPDLNIEEGRMPSYADFLAQVAKHFDFDYLSPINEPQWRWGSGDKSSQEGTQALNSDVAELTRLLSPRLKGTDIEIVVGEAGQWDYLFSKNEDGHGNQITEFFSSSSSNYLGDVPHVAPIISGHSYFSTCPVNTLINTRRLVAEEIKRVSPALEVWQTEFGILGNICDRYRGAPRRTDIDYGLYVATVIHHDLCIANVSSWHWWLAVSPYDYSDALVYINSSTGSINPSAVKHDGEILDSKQLWALGNYARFIRPGMVRIGTEVTGIYSSQTAAEKLMVSAYKDVDQGKVVVVVINPEGTSKGLSVQDGEGNSLLAQRRWNAYITDRNRNLEKATVDVDGWVAPPYSITTLVTF